MTSVCFRTDTSALDAAKIEAHINDLRTMDLTLWGPDRALVELGTFGLHAIGPIMHAAATGFDLTVKALDAVLNQLDEESGDRKEALFFLRSVIDDHSATAAQRAAAIEVAGQHFQHSESLEDALQRLACDTREPSMLRVAALNTLAPRRRLLKPILTRLHRLLDEHESLDDTLLAALVTCLIEHADALPHAEIESQLETLLESPDPHRRGLAIDLMGEVGALDAIEHVCIVPAAAEEIPRIQAMVARILQRPRNILSLRPTHFERFIGHLLRKMNFEDVEVTSPTNDKGVDVRARREGAGLGKTIREKWIVQCKRYKRTNVVRRDAVDALLRVRDAEGASKALLITTSAFTKDALACVAGRTDIQLTDGHELLHILAKYYGPKRYTIR